MKWWQLDWNSPRQELAHLASYSCATAVPTRAHPPMVDRAAIYQGPSAGGAAKSFGMKVAMSPRLPLLMSLLVLLACATEEPPVDETLPSLVYRERDGGLEPERLVRVNADGTGRQVLVQGTEENFAFQTFAVSPDGNTLIYRASTIGGTSEDWFSIPVTGGTPAPFAAPFGNLVGWAPTGDRIAWLVWDSSTIRLGVSAVGSAEITLLSPDTLAASDASWAPDGTRLVFAAQSFSTGAPTSSMYVVDLPVMSHPSRSAAGTT